MESTQVAIIGAGPIGLELAAALKLAGMDYIQFDAGQVAQTISWYPSQARFFSSPDRIGIAGLPLQTPDQSKASREEYLAYLRGVVEHYNLAVRTFERLTRLERRQGGGFVLHTVHGRTQNEYHADKVVLAIGDMHRPRLLHIPGEDLPHVTHYFDEPHRYFRQRLLIVGGRNSAVEAALRCYRVGAQVALSYRRAKFDEHSIKYWLLPEIKWLIEKGKIAFYPGTVPLRIAPDQVALGSSPECAAEGLAPLAARDIPADFVLLLTGYEMDTTLLAQAGAELSGANNAPVLNPQTMETSVPGLFVAGTAAGGTQIRFKLFIENCHVHAERIAQALTGRPDAGFFGAAARPPVRPGDQLEE